MAVTDGGHIYLECSNCRKKLADLWITNPELDTNWNVRADCPFCGDHSYNKEVAGGFAAAGYFINDSEGEDISVYCSTNLDDIQMDYDKGLVIIKVSKAQKRS